MPLRRCNSRSTGVELARTSQKNQTILSSTHEAGTRRYTSCASKHSREHACWHRMHVRQFSASLLRVLQSHNAYLMPGKISMRVRPLCCGGCGSARFRKHTRQMQYCLDKRMDNCEALQPFYVDLVDASRQGAVMMLISGAFASAEVLMQMRTSRSTPYLSIQGWRCTTGCRWRSATNVEADEGHRRLGCNRLPLRCCLHYCSALQHLL